MTDIERFMDKVDVCQDSCWNWTGALRKDGYGAFRLGEVLKASQASYILFIGPITDSLHVLHTCDNRKCVNPSHLFLGTHNDNMKDKKSKGRQSTSGNRKLSNKDVLQMRKEFKQGLSRKELAEKYKVHVTTVQRILNNSTRQGT